MNGNVDEWAYYEANPPAETYAIAWALFHARALEDEADRDVIDTVWAIAAIREFWLRQAQTALDAQALHRLGATRPEPVAQTHKARAEVVEQGRRLASERDDLIAGGINPAELAVPLHPDDV